jgi:hypothetical protein
LTRLANEKSYALVDSNRAGNNAFYVRRDVLGDIPEVTVEAAYVQSRFRESRNRAGELSYVSAHAERLRLIADLPLVDLESGRATSVSKRFGLV